MDRISLFASTSLFQECRHTQPSLPLAVAYCCNISAAFVLSLYILVPYRVRQLDRDDPLQIKWRSVATAIVCLFAILVYPICFCAQDAADIKDDREQNQPVLERMGFSILRVPFKNHFGPLLHSMVLYMGPIALIVLQAKLMSESTQKDSNPATFMEALHAVLFPAPQCNSTKEQQMANRWSVLRARVIAPIFEEVAFRACMVPVLAATGRFHRWTIPWVAPIFFGLAHCHHAALKLHQGERLSQVVMTTAFQFAYTTLFGAYAAHAFMRSRSVVGVILSHSFCNTMGLPSFYFLNKSAPMYTHKTRLMQLHFLGVAIFVSGFFTEAFIPLQST